MNRESERKRLVVLLSQFERTCPDNCTGLEKSCTQCVLEQKADHLLDNGIVVPPVKVGQTVYCIDRRSHLWWKGETISFYYANGCIEYGVNFDDGEFATYNENAVFTSREDAEKALKGEGK